MAQDYSILITFGTCTFFFFVLVAIMGTVVNVVNTYRDYKACKHELAEIKGKLREVALERNELRETVMELTRRERQQQPLNFFINDCTVEKLRKENKQLRAFNETYRKQLQKGEKNLGNS